MTSWRRVLLLLSGGVAIAALMLTAFAGASSSVEPRDVPLTVAGPPSAVAALSDQLDEAQPGAFEIRAVSDEAAARNEIMNRDAYGAVLLGPEGPAKVLTASAASVAVAQVLDTVAVQLGVDTTDMVPAPEQDPRGTILGSGSLPITVAGVAIGTVMSLLVRGQARKLVGVTAGAALMGGVTVGILHGWLGGLAGDWWLEVGIVALGVASIASVLTGLHTATGRAGLIAADVVLILVGNPFSGATSAPEMLPEPWSTVGHWLPLGATIDALRGISGFEGADILTPLLVLTSWLLLGLTLAVGAHRRHTTSALDALSTSSSPTAQGATTGSGQVG